MEYRILRIYRRLAILVNTARGELIDTVAWYSEASPYHDFELQQPKRSCVEFEVRHLKTM